MKKKTIYPENEYTLRTTIYKYAPPLANGCFMQM